MLARLMVHIRSHRCFFCPFIPFLSYIVVLSCYIPLHHYYHPAPMQDRLEVPRNLVFNIFLLSSHWLEHDREREREREERQTPGGQGHEQGQQGKGQEN